MLELVVRLGISLALVLGIFWAIARVGAKRLGGGRQSLLRVHGRQSLSRTSSVAVVEVGSRVLVVGVSDGGVRLLTELDPEEIAVEEIAAELDETDRATGATSLNPRRIRGVLQPGRGASAAHPGSAVAGSVLSTQTWKQAWTAATSRFGGTPADPAADPAVGLAPGAELGAARD